MSQPDFSKRSAGIEIMDDLNCAGEVVHQTLRELEFINRTLGGNAVTIDGVQQLVSESKETSIRVLDLGCGGGDMLKLLHRRIRGKNTYVGIDANPHIVEYARLHNSDPDISFETASIFSDEFKQETCDVAIATLFLHHFSDDQLVEIFTQLKKQAHVGIVINDLHRHPLAYYSIKLLTRFFSKSSMVKFDAPLSVLRGFSRKELESILERAGINKYSLKWKWAFRWQLVVYKN
jgi:2-polyprenyl-3-methyl-5-hydroxy-6-metoxy-1,4-benzoquinol methylase